MYQCLHFETGAAYRVSLGPSVLCILCTSYAQLVQRCGKVGGWREWWRVFLGGW